MWFSVEILNPYVVGLRGVGILASDHQNLLWPFISVSYTK